MTAWQDLPPRTRRQARMNERGEQPDVGFERPHTEPDRDSAPPSPFHQVAGTQETGDQAIDEQRSAGDPQGIGAAYSRRARRALGSAEHGATPLVPVDAGSGASGFRVRDFRPEPSAHPHAAFPAAADQTDATRLPEPTRELPRWSPPSTNHEGELSYFTQASPVQPRPSTPPPPPVVNSVPAAFAAPPRPMTRRQLRELESSQGTRPQADDAPPTHHTPTQAFTRVFSPQGAPSATPPAAPRVDAPRIDAPGPQPVVREPDAPRPAIAWAAMPQPAGPPVLRAARPIEVPGPAPAPPASVADAPPALVSPEPVVFADASGAPTPRAAAAVPVAPVPVADGIAARRGIDFAPEVYTAPVPQWSGVSPASTADQAGASFVRTIGTHTGALTTSALVIPSIPQASDITRPFSSTGEILVTGSIDLPHTLGTTGAHPARFDHSDIDALFAAEDNEFAPADSAPVRAIRAVSTHTSTHGVISAKKPASNRLPMMMAVTAGILAVGVVALLAAGMIFGYF